MTLALLTGILIAPTLSVQVRVDGPGYLRFVKEGRIVYATSSTLQVRDGALVDSHGPALTPAVRIPGETIKLNVDLEGNIEVQTASGKKAAGRIVLALFATPPHNEQGFLVSTIRAQLANPGDAQCGVIRTTGAQKPSILASTPSGSATIRIHSLTEFDGDEVTLGDVADIDADPQSKVALQAASLGTPPPVGIDMPITSFRIKAICKQLHVEADIELPAGAIIRRKSQTIQQSDFVAAAIKAAQERSGNLPLACRDQQPDFKIPVGQPELRAEGVSASGNVLAVTIGVYVNGKRVNSRVITLRPDPAAEIKPGATVKVVMKSAGVTVEVSGKARTGGVIGQTVTVVTESGAVLIGKVLSSDRVEVSLS